MPQVWRVKIFGPVFGWDELGRSISIDFGIYEMREIEPQLYQLTGKGCPAVRVTASSLDDYIGMRMSVIEGDWP